MALSPKQLSKMVNEIWDSNKLTVLLNSWLEKRLKGDYSSDLEFADDFDEIKNKLDKHIEKRILYDEKRYMHKYKFDDSLPNTLILTERKPGIVFLRKFATQIKETIRTMEWSKFEHLCKHLLKIIGCKVAGVIPTGRGGDFYGLLEVPTEWVLLKGTNIRIFGEAKHRSPREKIGEPEIRKFKTDYEDFKSKRGRAVRNLPNEFVKLNAPSIGMIITNSEFTTDAFKYAKREGIKLINGEQIVEDLIHSPQTRNWVCQTKNGHWSFNPDAFLNSF